jgi:hypothetical protein
MSKKYNYIIARFWDEDEYPTEKERLCVYMYRSGEVQFGTKEDAFKMAKLLSVKKESKLLSVKKEREYKPYFIDLNQNLVKIEEL